MGTQKPTAKYVKFIVYLAIAVLVNVAGTTLFFRVDLTENKAYSLSEASKRVVSGLSEPLTIKVFFSKNLPPPHNSTERYLHDLLEEYAANANQHFNYRFYDVSADSSDIGPRARENQKLAENYGIHPIQIQAIEQDEVKFQKAYMGLVLIHGDIIERIATITNIDGLEYRLTTTIQKLNNKISALLSLKEKIRVRLYLSSSLDAIAPLMGLEHLAETPRGIEKIVEKLNQKNYGKIAFEYKDPTRSPDADPETEKYNLLRLSWPAVSEKNIPAGMGVSGLVISYGEKAVTIPLIQVIQLPLIGTQYTQVGMEELEEVIDGSLTSLIDIHEDLGVLVGNGELNISGMTPPDPTRRQPDDVTGLRALVKQNYSIRDVNLSSGIPGSIQSLLIARPTKKISDYDLFQIDQFLMQGKNIALFLDAFEEVMPRGPQGMMGGQQPQYVPVDTGLEKLLAHYGVRINPAYALDEECFKQRVPEQMGGGQQTIYFAPMIQNRNISKKHRFMQNIKGLIALKNSPLSLLDDRIAKNNLKAERLFATSDRSWEMSGQINLNPMFIHPPSSEDEQHSLPLAYLLEGEFPSYFADKPIPEKIVVEKKDQNDTAGKAEKGEDDAGAKPQPVSNMPKIEGKGTKITKGKPGKILLVGSSEMLRDSLLSQEGRSPNAIFVMNVLDYLNNREDTAVMRSKEQRFNPLADTGPGVKTAVKAINIAGMPIMVAFFGLLVWSRRHSRKKKIKQMFAIQ